jgi:hypothetical protein
MCRIANKNIITNICTIVNKYYICKKTVILGRKRLTPEDFDGSLLKKNPFTENFSFPVFEKKSTQQLFEGHEGEMMTQTEYEVKKSMLIEVQRYAKVFDNKISRERLEKTSDRARTLWLYIVYGIRSGEDFIIVNQKNLLERWGLAYHSYRRAVSDLVDAGVIQYTNYSNVYWINPAVFFKGSRIRKYPDCVVMVEKKEQ